VTVSTVTAVKPDPTGVQCAANTICPARSSISTFSRYLLLATTGLRRGEALGLRWSDLDLDAGRASIRPTVIAIRHTVMIGTPKTAKGRRTVTLTVALSPRLGSTVGGRPRSGC
jgi:integrase